MKRLFIILMSIIMCISFAQYVYASDGISDLNSARFEFATEFLTKFYRYAYLCEVSDFSDYIKSDNFLAYINAYSESEYNKRVISNGASKALDVEYELLETHNLDGCVKFELISKLYFTYETYGNKDATEHGVMWRGSEIIVSGTESFEILDWYCEFNDNTIRSNPADPDFWEGQSAAEEVLTLLEERTRASISFRTEVEARASAEAAKASQINSSPSIQPRVIWPLNKVAIVNWAKYNALATDIKSGNSNQVPEYYDFSNMSGNYDCTNFASHAILAGGAPMYNNDDKSSGWYYVDAITGNYSHSWSGVPKL